MSFSGLSASSLTGGTGRRDSLNRALIPLRREIRSRDGSFLLGPVVCYLIGSVS